MECVEIRNHPVSDLKLGGEITGWASTSNTSHCSPASSPDTGKPTADTLGSQGQPGNDPEQSTDGFATTANSLSPVVGSNSCFFFPQLVFSYLGIL
jgi:hypothetical protein